MEVIVNGERHLAPAAGVPAALFKGGVCLELGAVPIDEILVPQRNAVKTAASAKVWNGLRLIQGIAVGIQPNCVYRKMGLVVYAGFVTALFLGPEFCAEPVAEEGDDVVRGDRA